MYSDGIRMGEFYCCYVVMTTDELWADCLTG